MNKSYTPGATVAQLPAPSPTERDLAALNQILRVLEPLDRTQRERIIRAAAVFYDLEITIP